MKPYQHNSTTIVSGLPRSGTSMVMQILEAGGMQILQDHFRTPDEDNPRGYFEFELVKQLKADSSWLDRSGGKAIKVIYALLPFLPSCYEYNILYLNRDLNEVIGSQATMLSRNGKPGGGIGPEALKSVFKKETEKTLAWLSTQPNMRVLHIQHRELIENPGSASAKINDFLGDRLIVRAMEQVIDPSLYRNRNI